MAFFNFLLVYNLISLTFTRRLITCLMTGTCVFSAPFSIRSSISKTHSSPFLSRSGVWTWLYLTVAGRAPGVYGGRLVAAGAVVAMALIGSTHGLRIYSSSLTDVSAGVAIGTVAALFVVSQQFFWGGVNPEETVQGAKRRE